MFMPVLAVMPIVSKSAIATIISTKEDQLGKVWAEPFSIDHSNDEFKTNSRAASDMASAPAGGR